MNPRQILNRLMLVSAAISVLICSPASRADASEIESTSYHLTRLEGLSGGRLNNLGQVIGTFPAEAGWGHHAAIYHSYGERAGSVDAILSPERNWTRGLLLNDRGQAVINHMDTLGDPTASSTLFWDGSEARAIEAEGKYRNFNAQAMNNAGTVVGTYSPDGLETRTGLWSDGQITPLAEASQHGHGLSSYAINDRGQIAGSVVSFASGPWGFEMNSRAVLWEDGQRVDLGTLGGGSASVADINNAGQVVGGAEGSDGANHAFLWQDGQMTALSMPSWQGSTAIAINSAGEILGIGSDDDWGNIPFVYSDGSYVLLQDLLPPEFDFQTVNYRDINDLGQILVEYWTDWGWDPEYLLLTPGSMEAPAPLGSNSTTIPEPTTVAMICLIGAAALARGACRKVIGRARRRGA